MTKPVVLAVFVLTYLGISAAGLLPYNLREIKSLLAIVDPKTCSCVQPQHCSIAIRGAHLVGFRCNARSGDQFCCERRIPGRGSSASQPTTQLSSALATTANVRELNKLINDNGNNVNSIIKAAQQGISKHNNDLAKGEEEELEELLLPEADENVRIKLTDAVSSVPSSPKTESHFETVSDPQDDHVDKDVSDVDDEAGDGSCICVPSDKCAPHEMDFTFGRSCGFGSVRCCRANIDNTAAAAVVLRVLEEEAAAHPVQDADGDAEVPVIGLPYSVVPENEPDIERKEDAFQERSSSALEDGEDSEKKEETIEHVPEKSSNVEEPSKNANKDMEEYQRYITLLAHHRRVQAEEEARRQEYIRHQGGMLAQIGYMWKQMTSTLSSYFGGYL